MLSFFFLSACNLIQTLSQIETAVSAADKYRSMKFAMNKASSNTREILDAFLRFTVIVILVTANWLQDYKARALFWKI